MAVEANSQDKNTSTFFSSKLSGLIPYFLTFLLISTLLYHVDGFAQKLNQQKLRADVHENVQSIVAKLEQCILSNSQLVHGLIFSLKAEPNMSPEKFNQIASQLFNQESLIRVVAVAPDLVNNRVYPLKGFEHVMGMDYRTMPKHLSAALEAKKTKQVVIAGPHDLPKKGTGLIMRYPIFLPENGKDQFWGIASAVLDVGKLFELAGLNSPDLQIDVAIRGKDGKGAFGEQFFGNAEVLDSNPEFMTVDLPNGSWQIAAMPKGGWVIPASRIWTDRLVILGFGILLTIPLLLVGQLASRRRLHLTELQQAKSQIEHFAMHDALTGLPNRRYFETAMEKLTPQQVAQTCLILVDLDRFKEVNDTLGHAAGDALLVHLTRILKSSIGKNDFAARMGGDEFVIVSRGGSDIADIEEMAGRIISLMEIPFVYNDQKCHAGVSIGIAPCSPEITTAKQLLVNADLALYLAKDNGRNRYEFFTSELQALSLHKKEASDDILRGLENNEFIPFYQPQVDAKTLKVCGVEALVRWDHPEKGLLSPDKFLTVAREIGVNAKIDELILKQTIKDLDRWCQAGVDIPRASVNVSQQRLYDEQLINTLKELKIVPGKLSFELVESIFLDEGDDVVLKNIQAIKDMGIRIEIDDFGTGHASLVSLLKTKPATLKIDRQLVQPSTVTEGAKQMVKSIIDIAKSQNIEIVAEGIESADHTLLLRKLGCDVLQGYAFARPMTARELEEFVETDMRIAV